MSKIIAIDPGRMTGWAHLSVEIQPKLLSFGDLRVYDESPLNAGVSRVFRARIEEALVASATAAIEAQYVGCNPDSTIKLARTAGRWAEICLQHGSRVRWINPQVWQRAALGRLLPSRAPTRAQRKAAAAGAVRGLYDIEVGSDAADAIMLGRYCAINEYFVELGKEVRVD